MLAQFREVGHVSSKLSLTKQIPGLLYLIFIYTHANVTQTGASSAFVWGTIFSCGLLPFLCASKHFQQKDSACGIDCLSVVKKRVTQRIQCGSFMCL